MKVNLVIFVLVLFLFISTGAAAVSEVEILKNIFSVETEKTENGYSLQFEKGTAPAQITLNSEGKIIGLWFGNYSLAEDNLDTILAELKELPGELSISLTSSPPVR